MKFPKNFYFGVGTSAHQIEGSLENDWSRWEKSHSKKESEFYRNGGVGFFNYPIGEENIREAKLESNYISGIGCDSYNRYKEDVRAIKEMGLNAYRFSVDWSRIQPEKGKYSSEGIEYYKNLVKELKDNGIEPFLTCWHWPIPIWLEDEGGLLSKNIVEYFSKYVDFLVRNLGNDVKYWITINEPEVYASSAFLSATRPPQYKNIFKFLKVYFFSLVKMHKEGYRVLKEYDSDIMVSIAKNNQHVSGNFLFKCIYNFLINDLFLILIKNHLDCIGLNFYFHFKLGIKGMVDFLEKKSDIGWGLDPYSIYFVLKKLKKYNLPIYITENGLADREDKYRKWWLDETFRAMSDALEDGVDLRGYLHWSLIDNFEWSEGFWPKFGLVDIDRNIKESGRYYGELIKKYSS
jgi:beta-glucosidase